MKIQNDHTEKILKLGDMNEAESIAYMRSNSDDLASVEMIIGGYTIELLRTAEEVGLELDLSYETLNNVPAVAMFLYNKQHASGYDDSDNQRVTCRTIAGYLTTLAINNHELGVEAKTYSNNKNEIRPEQWADRFVIKLNHKKNSDLLPYVWEGTTSHPIEIENGFMIDIGPLVEAYKRLTGVDLAEKGLANMVLTYGDNVSE